jgi:hypothetical protein
MSSSSHWFAMFTPVTSADSIIKLEEEEHPSWALTTPGESKGRVRF